MRIGVVSDSHGDHQAIARVVAAAGRVDLWLHAGDCSQDAAWLTGARVIAAAGNCDGRAAAKPDEFFEAAGKKIWLTHGHRYQVKQGSKELSWWGRHYAVDIVVFGHTHNPLIEAAPDLLLVNPGSVARPNSGAYPTYAIIEIVDEQASATILNVN